MKGVTICSDSRCDAAVTHEAFGPHGATRYCATHAETYRTIMAHLACPVRITALDSAADEPKRLLSRERAR